MSQGEEERGMLGAPADDPLGQRELFEALRARLFGREPAAERIDRYELRERIGGGGGGIVYRAWDTVLQRRVALKLIRDATAPDGEQLTQRLRHEARALAQAEHPNVLPIYGVGEDAGRIYVAMELVDGVDLQAWLRAESRSRSAILEVFVAAGQGLAAAHAAGVVHRDFKPANVMVGHDGRVRVMDFGIARFERRAASTAQDSDASPQVAPSPRSKTGGITHTGAILGTPAYMAPEQWDRAQVGSAADQYSYCAALSEALTGYLPGERQGRRTAIELDPNLARALARGLEEQPDQRWPSMLALLQQFDKGEQVSNWRRRSVAVLGAAGLVFVASRALDTDEVCVDADASLLWTATDRDDVAAAFAATEVPFARYTWERVDARIEEYRGRWSRQLQSSCGGGDAAESIRQKQCLDDALRRARQTVDLFKNADRTTVRNAVRAVTALPEPRRCAQRQPLRTAELEPWFARLDEALALAHIGRYEESIAMLEHIVVSTRPDEAPSLQARALQRWGTNLFILSRPQEAAQRLEDAAWLADEAGDHETAAEAMTTLILVVGSGLAKVEEARRWDRHARVAIERVGEAPELEAERLDNLGILDYNAGEYARSRELRERALALVEGILPADDPTIANYLNGIGNTYFSQGRLDEAEDHYRRVIAIRESAYGTDHPIVATSLNNLANVRRAVGDDDGALALYERSVHLKEQAFGDRHEAVAIALTNLANMYLARGDYERGRSLYERALAIWEDVVGDSHPDIAGTLSNLGALELQAGREDVARSHLERALAVLESTVGSDHPAVAEVLTNLAMALSTTGQRKRAVTMHERALASFRRTYGPEHPKVAMSITNLASEEFAGGDFDEAARMYGDAVEIRRGSQGEHHPDQAIPLTGLGRSLVHAGRPAEAVEPLRRALLVLRGRDVAPDRRAQPRYALARALWRAGGDRVEALELAAEALEAFESGEDNLVEDADIVRAWLANPR